MVAVVCASTRAAWVLPQIKRRDGVLPLSSSSPSLHLNSFQKDSQPFSPPSPPPPPNPSPGSRISPAVLFIIVILAVIFFISGLLHLLVRFLVKKRPPSSSSPRSHRNQAAGEISGSEALQRQLQQLFHLHDSGLDQAFIDALPVFLYREIVGPKEPFDCAVCLCEFADDDKLRLLPVCGHAFHITCIDTWLLSNSTCPLCRGALFIQGLSIENPIFDFEDLREEEAWSGDRDDGGFSLPGQKPAEAEEIAVEKRVFPVRLGKFKSVSNTDGGGAGGGGGGGAAVAADGGGNTDGNLRREEGESSSSNLDARRCFSMGSYQYVLGDANLRVALCPTRNGDGKGIRGRGISTNPAGNEVPDGKRLSARSRGESFSVSKIWQWSNKKGKFPIAAADAASSLDGGFPWARRSVGDT